MNIFGEDGPEAIPNQKEDQNEKTMNARSRYMHHFMIDFIEYNLRQVASENIIFCADRC